LPLNITAAKPESGMPEHAILRDARMAVKIIGSLHPLDTLTP